MHPLSEFVYQVKIHIPVAWICLEMKTDEFRGEKPYFGKVCFQFFGHNSVNFWYFQAFKYGKYAPCIDASI